MRQGWLSSTSPWRGAFDAFWILACAAVMVALFARPRASALGGGVVVELYEGEQRQVILRGDKRIGWLYRRIEKRAPGWRLTDRFFAGDERIGRFEMTLAKDLTLRRLSLEMELQTMPALVGVNTRLLKRRLGSMKVAGRCAAGGSCRLRGRFNGREVDQQINVGRGPVLTSAIYPLLARGALGRKVELAVFDPLTMGTRLVTFEVGKRETLALRSGSHEALRVGQDAGGLKTVFWLDRRGRVLREDLPLGVRIEHDTWSDR